MVERNVLLKNAVTKYSIKLLQREEINHDTRRFRFALENPQQKLGLPVGQHVYFYATINGKPVSRAYTPITSDRVQGYFDLVIKVYFPVEKFPKGGAMTQHLNQLKVGDEILVRGPSGKHIYKGKGVLQTGKASAPTLLNCRKIGMIAGGSGITPMWQLVLEALEDPQDETEFYLLFANKSEDDILLREQIEQLGRKHKRFNYWYTIDQATQPDWKFSTGFITKELISQSLPAPADDSLILICGPKPMIEFACMPNLTALGYDEARIVKY